MKNFEDLLEACGGSLEIAYRLKIRQQTVESWQRIGVPLKYWDELCNLAKKPRVVNPEKLFQLNRTIEAK